MTMEIRIAITDQPSSISEHQKTKSSQDAMRTRVRLFTEGVLKMVSPVLLALALYKKFDSKGEGTWFVRGSISPIAAVTMAFGILLMVLLWRLCLSNLVARHEWLQDAASKLLVHLCAILLMCLAYDILLLISMEYRYSGIIVVPLVAFVMFCCICSLRVGGHGRDNADAHANACYDRDMELSVDFSATFTTLLFLGLERLALEVHLASNREGGMVHHDLVYCLAVNFIACLIGVVIMLVWTIPPSAENDIDKMRECIEACNVALALSIAGIVLWITWAQLNANALWVIVPPFFSFVSWMCICLDDEQPNGRNSTQPAQQTSEEQQNLSANQQQQVEDNGRYSTQPGEQPQGEQHLSGNQKVKDNGKDITKPDEQTKGEQHLSGNQQVEDNGRDNTQPGEQPQGEQHLSGNQKVENNGQDNTQPCEQPQREQHLSGNQKVENNGRDNTQLGEQPQEDQHLSGNQQVEDNGRDSTQPGEQPQGEQHLSENQKVENNGRDNTQPGEQPQGEQHLSGNQQVEDNGRDSTKPDEQIQGEQHLSRNLKVEDNGRNKKVPSPPDDTSEVKLVKPPSLELTKLALLGFFAVSTQSISDSSHCSWTHAFILLTAMSVVSALVWRLLGHRASPEQAEITAANIASIFAHGFAIAALVPFAVMAHMNAQLL